MNATRAREGTVRIETRPRTKLVKNDDGVSREARRKVVEDASRARVQVAAHRETSTQEASAAQAAEV